MAASAESISRRPKLSATVIGLGWVSLLTDASSELIFPLLPVFLIEVLGAPATFLGLLEGMADGTASLVKYLSGRAADRAVRLKPLVVGGYTLSTLMRPLVALATAPWQVLAVRVTDRIGKGIRSSPRDAMIAHAADPTDRGRSFGFHMAMDHAGSAVGTLLGAGLLALKLDLRTVFWIASVPGLISLVVLALVREPLRSVPDPAAPVAQTSVERLPAALWRYLGVLFVFTTANSTDAFLILKAREVGASRVVAPLLWLVLHVVKAALGTAGGALSDKFSRVALLAAGWACYGLTYLAMGQQTTVLGVFAVAAFYGSYTGLAEGAEKAQVADLAPSSARGRAFGLYNMVNGLGVLAAGLIFGALWDHYGSTLAFRVAGGQALLAALLLLVARVGAPPRPQG